MKMTVSEIGLSAALKVIGADMAKLPQALASALYEEGEEIMGRAKDEFVPVDTGNLRESGHVVPPKHSGSSIVVELAFGGTAAPYAVAVHERTEVAHKVGQAKYLEQPALEAEQGMDERVARRVREKMAR